MADLSFLRLNDGWNAEPNAPVPEVRVEGTTVFLSFFLNPWEFQGAPDEKGVLAFPQCSQWRLGPTNDEGWYRGQCRYSGIAPAWGEFYELVGEDPLANLPQDWRQVGPSSEAERHYLFYLRDETFECFAPSWSFTRTL
jgi:hypothetical protein